METKTDYMLTTFDNPFDPFEQFTSWLMFDKEKGYDSCEKLARIAELSDDMSDVERERETERAIDEIIKHDFTNTFTRAFRKGVTALADSQEPM